MVPETPLTRTEHGLVPEGEGWFVVNAREAEWQESPDFGRFCGFEGESHFPQYGVNIHVLLQGKPNCMYHAENEQEDFLVLSGECVLLIEGEERRLRAWDFVHCPAWTEHVFVGTSTEPCAVLMMGTRNPGSGVRYPVSELALRHRAGVDQATESAAEAYANTGEDRPIGYQAGDLPGG